MTAQTPQIDAQQKLDAATGELENAELDAARLKAALLEGDETVTPESIDAAETRVRHAVLGLDAAKAAHTRAHDQARRNAWPVIRDAHATHIIDNPAGHLSKALAELAPQVQEALATLEAALDEAKGPAVRHNGAVAALAQYVTAGGYTDPEDRVVVFGRSNVSFQSRGGEVFDFGTAVDLWLAEQLPTERIAEWLERVRIAKERRYPH